MPTQGRKGWKGLGMEGRMAHWYTRTRRKDMAEFRGQAEVAAQSLRSGCDVLEVAPGPGFFAIELAKLGQFKITGLDVSHTFVEIATSNARAEGVEADFVQGSASAMPFPAGTFDFVYCSAAFKNFSEPVRALDEMHRVLRPGGNAVVVDLRKDASRGAINTLVDESGRSRVDAWVTKWTFRLLLQRRAYTEDDFCRMVAASRFGACEIVAGPIGLEVRLTKPVDQVVPVS